MSPHLPQRQNFRFFFPQAIRWSDMDVLGHVNNARYLTYFETVRIDFFREIKFDRFWSKEMGPILARIDCNFLMPLTHEHQIEIGVRPVHIGRTSFHLEHGIFLKEQATLAAHGIGVIVWINFETGKPIPLSDTMRALLEQAR